MLKSKQIDLDKHSYPWYEQVFDFFFNNKIIEVSYWYERIKKNIRFYWNVLRFDYDFDSHGYLLMLNYKFKEVLKCIENDHAIQDPKDLKALRICIKLTQKLWDDDYEARTWRKIESQFGKLGHRFEDLNDGSDCSRWISNYGGNESDEYREKVWAVRKPMYEIVEKCQQRDERNLYAIMLKYRRAWWS